MKEQDAFTLMRPYELPAVWTGLCASVLLAGRVSLSSGWIIAIVIAVTLLHISGTCVSVAITHQSNSNRRKGRKHITRHVLLLMTIIFTLVALALLWAIGFIATRGNGLFPLLGGSVLLLGRIITIVAPSDSNLSCVVPAVYRTGVYLTVGWCIQVELPLIWFIGLLGMVVYQIGAGLGGYQLSKKPQPQLSRRKIALACLGASSVATMAVWWLGANTGIGWAVMGFTGLIAIIVVCWHLTRSANVNARRQGDIGLYAGACLLDGALITSVSNAMIVAGWLGFLVTVILRIFFMAPSTSTR